MTVIYDKVEFFHAYLGVMVAQVVVFGHLSDYLFDERLVSDVRYWPDKHFHLSFSQHFYHSWDCFGLAASRRPFNKSQVVHEYFAYGFVLLFIQVALSLIR